MGGKCDLTGRKFGKLTVVGKTGETQEHYRVWRCRCDCGEEILVNTKRLKNGTVTNCGCIPKATARRGRTAEDLSGRRFGSLTVLYRVENRNGRTCWMCRCDCGKKKTVTARDLKAGKVKSCGYRTHDGEGNRVDLSGKLFGRLTAVEPIARRDRKGSIYWRCVCSCGNETEVTEDCLVQGNVMSCGCLKRENQKRISGRLHRVDGTCVEILEKRKYRKDNSSGFRGVFKTKEGKYRVNIGFKRQRFYLGSYTEYQEAVKARMDAEKVIHDGFLKAYYEWKRKAEQNPEWAKEHKLKFDVVKENGKLIVIEQS